MTLPIDSPTAPPVAAPPRREALWPTMLRIAALFLVAAALRGWIAATPGIGHDLDIELFVRWMRGLADHGLTGFYQHESFCDYPPLMLLTFRALSSLADAVAGGQASPAQLTIVLKGFASAADLLIGILLLIEGRRLLGLRAGVVAASLYLLNPLSIYNSAFWGQLDAAYAALLLCAFLCVGRRWWLLAGACSAAAVGAKFQAVAILPLVAFEVFRIGGWRGVGRAAIGIALAAGLIATPLALNGIVRESLERGYVRVVGQYYEQSKNAYNLWYLIGDPEASDTSPPAAVVRYVAAGRDSIPADASPLMHLTIRNLSLAAFALGVLASVALYSLRPAPLARYAAGGVLALCFFLLPTEMHERYAFPAVALLAIWAAARPQNERLFWILTLLLTLNQAAVLSPSQIASPIAACLLCVFALLVAQLLAGSTTAVADSAPVALATAPPEFEPTAPAAVRVIRVFRWSVAGLFALTATAAGWLVWAMHDSSTPSIAGRAQTPTSLSLTKLAPRTATQGWRSLATDRAVSGGSLRLGDTIYLQGLGTHAPATIVYDIPPGYDAFEATIGIDHATRGGGSAIVHIDLDGRTAHTTAFLTSNAPPETVRLPLGAARRLRITVDPTPDGKRSDHVDLVLARFTRTAASQPAAPSSAPTTTATPPKSPD